MNNRIWIIVTAIVVVGVLALGYFLGIAPRLAEKTDADTQLVAAEAQNQQYAADLAALKAQYENIDEVRNTLDDLRANLPSGDAYTEFLRELNQLAGASGVNVVSVTTNTPVVYGATTAADSTAGTEPISGGTLIAIPVTISLSSLSADALLQMVHVLQEGQRLYSASDFKLVLGATSDKKGVSSIELNGFIYTLLDPNAVVPDPVEPEVTTDPGPTQTPVPTDSATPTP